MEHPSRLHSAFAVSTRSARRHERVCISRSRPCSVLNFTFTLHPSRFRGLLIVAHPLVCPPQLVAAVSHGGYNFYCQKTHGPQDVDNRVGWLHATCTLYSIHTAAGFGFNLNRCFETFHPEMRSQPSVTLFFFVVFLIS